MKQSYLSFLSGMAPGFFSFSFDRFFKIYEKTATFGLVFLIMSACQNNDASKKSGSESTSSAIPAHTTGYNKFKNPYFGQTHQHTGWSFDAYMYDVKLGPDNAYRYARGEKVKHPAGFDVQLKVPLDFMMVSDHSEYLGVIRMMDIEGSPVYNHPLATQVRAIGKSYEKGTKMFYEMVSETIQPDGTTKADPALNTPEIKRTNWDEMVKFADQFYEPGKFTTFAAYEWSSQPNMSNLHRIVLFKDTKNLPVPFSYFDSEKPEDLWKWMDVQRANGTELLAIPHNGNLSNGLMFGFTDSYGKPIDRAYAESRMRNEPLVEILQIKGQSETHPQIAPNDEFAGNFEIWTKAVAGPNKVKVLETNYVRNAFENGMVLEQKIGANPFKYGVVAGSDAHTSIMPSEEYAYTGEHNLKSGTPEQRLLEKTKDISSKIEQGSAGLSCVWAEENTRASIYEAMKRKETWATSGPRIQVRVFAGYDFGDAKPGEANWAEIGYKNGVPMGGDIKGNGNGKPVKLMVWALKGPNSGNLDRIQVIKGWVDKSGKAQEKIYDVIWSGDRKPDDKGILPPVGNTVDIKTATYTNSIGAANLQTVWTDPDFDPSVPCFYYLRVLEIPTPRWSTYDAAKLGIAPPEGFPATIQERAWTSPIWYNPK